MRKIEGDMASKSHTIETTMVYGNHVYKEIWFAWVGEEQYCAREVENYCDPFTVTVVITMVMPFLITRKRSCANLRISFCFVGLIFVDWQVTVKTRENFSLHGNINKQGERAYFSSLS